MPNLFSLSVDQDINLLSPNIEMAAEMHQLIAENRVFLDQYITFAHNKKDLKSVTAFLREIANFNYGGQKFNLVIQYQGRLVGIIGFHRLHPVDARAEIGYWLGEAYQGNGILKRSIQPFLHHGFEALGVNRVDLLTLTTHTRSIALAQRAGFVAEGTLRSYYFMHGRFQDALIYSCLKAEFLANYKPHIPSKDSKT